MYVCVLVCVCTDANAATTNGSSPLYFAIKLDMSNTLKQLLAKGADPNQLVPGAAGSYPLVRLLQCATLCFASGTVVALSGCGAFSLAVRLIFPLGLSKQRQHVMDDTAAISPLLLACRLSREESSCQLIDKGADVNWTSSRGMTPLLEAVRVCTMKDTVAVGSFALML